MPIASLILLLAQLLPTIVNDVEAVTAALDTSSTAIKNAQAGDGTISAADWAALDAATNTDLSALATAAGMTPPAVV
jgi:hypothetical protein